MSLVSLLLKIAFTDSVESLCTTVLTAHSITSKKLRLEHTVLEMILRNWVRPKYSHAILGEIVGPHYSHKFPSMFLKLFPGPTRKTSTAIGGSSQTLNCLK